MKLLTQHPRAVSLVSLAACVAALSLAPIAAQAQAPAAPPKAEKAPMMSADDVLKALDKNGDGTVDRDEAKADSVVDKNFTAINKSGTGKINRDELDAFMMKK